MVNKKAGVKEISTKEVGDGKGERTKGGEREGEEGVRGGGGGGGGGGVREEGAGTPSRVNRRPGDLSLDGTPANVTDDRNGEKIGAGKRRKIVKRRRKTTSTTSNGAAESRYGVKHFTNPLNCICRLCLHYSNRVNHFFRYFS